MRMKTCKCCCPNCMNHKMPHVKCDACSGRFIPPKRKRRGGWASEGTEASELISNGYGD